MMQKKKTQKKKEDDKSGKGDPSMDDVARLEGEFQVSTSKSLSDSEALVVGLLLKDGKDSTSQFYGKAMTTQMIVTRMDHWGLEEEECRSTP
jgi:hypothetical protein